ncbi:MAG: RHS repeat-associated core domain-containing protein [Chloroflexi bacterium]|nr:RHS repeat-associated core domain-containing protein [Chloroflexota bacterium]
MTYRGNGQTERTDKGNTTYLYDRTFIPPVVENDGTTITTYITAPSGSLLGFKRGTSYYWYLKDAIGSVVGVMDNSGTVVNTYSYDPFGNILTSSETVTQPFKFAGAYYDAELTLYKMGARYYDPRIGRFLQPDPLGMDLMSPTTWDLYAYAGNNPVNWTDASGEVCWKCWGEKLVGNSGYFDLNVGVGLIVGVTFGVVLDRDGLRLYVGGGFVALPGVSVTASPNSPTEAWNAGIQRDPTWQLRMEWTSWHGLLPRARPVHRGGSGTPGLSLTGYYVFPPWQWIRFQGCGSCLLCVTSCC